MGCKYASAKQEYAVAHVGRVHTEEINLYVQQVIEQQKQGKYNVELLSSVEVVIKEETEDDDINGI